jgi:hypothetical protein
VNCKRIRPLLSVYHDGELDPARETDVAAHLAACPECTRVLDEYRALGQDVRGLPSVRVPAGMANEFETRLRRLNTSPWRGARGLMLRRRLSIAAITAALAALAFGVYIILQQMQPLGETAGVAAAYPENGARDVPLDANLTITFDRLMDQTSVEDAASITPQTELAFGWQGQTLTIVPFTNWQPATTYTLTVATSARTAAGTPLDEPIVLRFTTEKEEPAGGGLNPIGRFGLVWRAEIGGPGGTMGYATDEVQELWSATQPVERGRMIWVDQLEGDTIYVLTHAVDESGGTWQAYVDTFREGEVESSGLTPPDGMLEPIRGFGKVWREQLGGPDARVGWALASEQGYVGEMQPFEHGLMLWDPLDGVTYVLLDDGIWSAHPLAE